MSLCALGGVREGCLEEVTQRASMVRHQEGSKLPGEDCGVPLVRHLLGPQARQVGVGRPLPLLPLPVLCYGLGHACCPSGQAVLSLSSGSR